LAWKYQRALAFPTSLFLKKGKVLFFFLINAYVSAKQGELRVTGEIPRVDLAAGRGAEGETPKGRGKLSGKRTVIHCIPWREPFVRPPKGKAHTPWAKGNLSGKRTGELRNDFEAPLFFLTGYYHGFRIIGPHAH